MDGRVGEEATEPFFLFRFMVAVDGSTGMARDLEEDILAATRGGGGSRCCCGCCCRGGERDCRDGRKDGVCCPSRRDDQERML